MHDDARGFETRAWKAHGITHAVHQRASGWPLRTHTTTDCGQTLPNLPWRNTQRFCLEKINCMACIAVGSGAP